jgi:hypothetical protein
MKGEFLLGPFLSLQRAELQTRFVAVFPQLLEVPLALITFPDEFPTSIGSNLART